MKNKRAFDLSTLSWTLTGFTPHEWRQIPHPEVSVSDRATVPGVPARVPGSVQLSLREAGLLPDWNVGENAKACEWVENRHWIYSTRLPDEWVKAARGGQATLVCQGLDYCGEVRINKKTLYTFANSQIPHHIDLSDALDDDEALLEIIFECPPRWLGQFGKTSEMIEWKPRYNYTWDWTARLVQIGIWDDIRMEVTQGWEIQSLESSCSWDVESETGAIQFNGTCVGAQGGQLRFSLERDNAIIKQETVSAQSFQASGLSWQSLAVEAWYPNGLGEQPLYTLKTELLTGEGECVDTLERTLGFVNISWAPCEEAPEGAPNWICVANGKPLFIQGINWTPMLPNFADLTEAHYRRLLEQYKQLNVNLLRVWGGAFLEKQWFYDICDELGLLVWQEFPLSSSGVDNYPPDDEKAMNELEAIARSFVTRRRHHVCQIIWCGGNELREGKTGNVPVTTKHPLMQRFEAVVNELDPSKRFLPSTPNGPNFGGGIDSIGKGINWAVNSPWKANGHLDDSWTELWKKDDSLLRSETGAPGPCSAAFIHKYKGELEGLPVDSSNALWRRAPWWIETPQFVKEEGHAPKTLEEFIEWGEARQKKALTIAANACKNRYPRCAGYILWMGHDSFPCPTNTSIIDFDGNVKPAGHALGEIFGRPLGVK